MDELDTVVTGNVPVMDISVPNMIDVLIKQIVDLQERVEALERVEDHIKV